MSRTPHESKPGPSSVLLFGFEEGAEQLKGLVGLRQASLIRSPLAVDRGRKCVQFAPDAPSDGNTAEPMNCLKEYRAPWLHHHNASGWPQHATDLEKRLLQITGKTWLVMQAPRTTTASMERSESFNSRQSPT